MHIERGVGRTTPPLPEIQASAFPFIPSCHVLHTKEVNTPRCLISLYSATSRVYLATSSSRMAVYRVSKYFQSSIFLRCLSSTFAILEDLCAVMTRHHIPWLKATLQQEHDCSKLDFKMPKSTGTIHNRPTHSWSILTSFSVICLLSSTI